MSSKKAVKSALESILFIWGEPLDVKTAAEVFNLPWKEVYVYLQELADEYQQEQRGIYIREVDKCFQFVTREENGMFIEKLCTPVKDKRLSTSAMEVLAIVAYKQPVTRGEIDSIRGIKCDRVIEGLERKGLVHEAGRSPAIGRPILYGTTRMFLEKFGFKSLKELPEIQDVEGLFSGMGDDDEQDDSRQISIDLMQGDNSMNI